MTEEIKNELTSHILPFWKGMKDETHGGYYGYLSEALVLDPKADKGCILHARILWFFSECSRILHDPSLLPYAEHAFWFMKEYLFDRENGGLYWSVTFDGKPADTQKHVYNQAFGIYALSAYYRASGDAKALELALSLYHLIEERMRDAVGYLEAFTREFRPGQNEKLSENGVEAARTMNTLLHVMEAYTELCAASKKEEVRDSLLEVMDILYEKVWDPQKKQLAVFFDKAYHSLIDLWSCGHDIEAAWLIDHAAEVLEDANVKARFAPVSALLAERCLTDAFDGESMPMEVECGIVNESRIWWIQAEAVNGFLNHYRKTKDGRYLDAARAEWTCIKAHFIDKRPGAEWISEFRKDWTSIGKPIAEPWKGPYHNGRMCLLAIEKGDMR